MQVGKRITTIPVSVKIFQFSSVLIILEVRFFFTPSKIIDIFETFPKYSTYSKYLELFSNYSKYSNFFVSVDANTEPASAHAQEIQTGGLYSGEH